MEHNVLQNKSVPTYLNMPSIRHLYTIHCPFFGDPGHTSCEKKYQSYCFRSVAKYFFKFYSKRNLLKTIKITGLDWQSTRPFLHLIKNPVNHYIFVLIITKTSTLHDGASIFILGWQIFWKKSSSGSSENC